MFNKKTVLMIPVFSNSVFSFNHNRSQLLTLDVDWLWSSPKHRSTLPAFLSSPTPHGHSDWNPERLTCLTYPLCGKGCRAQERQLSAGTERFSKTTQIFSMACEGGDKMVQKDICAKLVFPLTSATWLLQDLAAFLSITCSSPPLAQDDMLPNFWGIFLRKHVAVS